jgi:hypothetical protein
VPKNINGSIARNSVTNSAKGSTLNSVKIVPKIGNKEGNPALNEYCHK